MTNYEFIKNMDIDEMAAFITKININSHPKLKKGKSNAIVKYFMATKNKKWLESEAEVNDR